MPPELIFGVTPTVALAQAEDLAERGRDRRGRRVKVDARILVSVVVGYPLTWTDIRSNPAELERCRRWQELEVAFLRKEFGSQLASAVLHRDEPRPHLHGFVLGRLTPHVLSNGRLVQRLDLQHADSLRFASEMVRQSGGSRDAARNAGRQAGASLQLRHAREVGLPLGFAPGDGRSGARLDRIEALIRRAVADRTAELQAELAEYRAREGLHDRALLAWAADRRAQGAGPAERLIERAVRRKEIANAIQAGSHAPATYEPVRLADDGALVRGGAALQPAEPLRPPRAALVAREHHRGDEAAISMLTAELLRLSGMLESVGQERDSVRREAEHSARDVEALKLGLTKTLADRDHERSNNAVLRRRVTSLTEAYGAERIQSATLAGRLRRYDAALADPTSAFSMDAWSDDMPFEEALAERLTRYRQVAVEDAERREQALIEIRCDAPTSRSQPPPRDMQGYAIAAASPAQPSQFAKELEAAMTSLRGVESLTRPNAPGSRGAPRTSLDAAVLQAEHCGAELIAAVTQRPHWSEPDQFAMAEVILTVRRVVSSLNHISEAAGLRARLRLAYPVRVMLAHLPEPIDGGEAQRRVASGGEFRDQQFTRAASMRAR